MCIRDSDNVEKCLELLNSEQSFRMPISNGAPSDPSAAYVRGIITRKGGFITDFQVMIKFKQFNRGKQCVYKMDTTKPFALEQVEAIKQNLETVSRLLESLQICEDVDTFAEDLAQVMQLLATSTNLLQYPPRELLFPYNKNLVLTQMFGSSDALIETNHHILSLDLVILYTEISMDFRNLRKVTTKPWCEFDPMTGTTFTDVVRDNLKSQRGKKLVQVLQDLGLHIEEPSLLRNMLPLKNAHNTTTLDEARDILARCVTSVSYTHLDVYKRQALLLRICNEMDAL